VLIVFAIRWIGFIRLLKGLIITILLLSVVCLKGDKGITDLKSALQVPINLDTCFFCSHYIILIVCFISPTQNIFAETIVDTKDEFLQTFSTQRDFIRCITAYLLVAFIPSQICSQLNYDRSLCSLWI